MSAPVPKITCIVADWFHPWVKAYIRRLGTENVDQAFVRFMCEVSMEPK